MNLVTDYNALDILVDEALNSLDNKVLGALESAAEEIVELLKSYTSVTKDGRAAHLGAWGDITYNLMKSYQGEVSQSGDTFTLTLSNSASYAVYLDRRAGYFVLKGVIDRERDPGAEIIKRHLLAVLPNFK